MPKKEKVTVLNKSVKIQEVVFSFCTKGPLSMPVRFCFDILGFFQPEKRCQYLLSPTLIGKQFQTKCKVLKCKNLQVSPNLIEFI